MNKMISPKMVSIISKAFRHCNATLHFFPHLPFCGMRYSPHDLEDLDSRYRVMNEMHNKAHTGLIQEMRERQFSTVMEVACETGWNIPHFQKSGLKYYGLDISETAIAIAMMKYPEHQYFNLGVCDSTILSAESFDVVYSSSMLEHIGYYEEAMREMIRLAKKEVWILFSRAYPVTTRTKSIFILIRSPRSTAMIKTFSAEKSSCKVIFMRQVRVGTGIAIQRST
jgi:ubiquinone/menaquinone biosynthesis C-methylase UbiE